MSDDDSNQDRYPYFFLPRPKGQLRSLPVKMRWEVTRRHPIYSCFWKSARDLQDGVTDNDPLAATVRKLADELVRSIGVSGRPMDPALEFEELDEDSLDQVWMSGAVSPLILRNLFGLLIAGLPPESFIHCCVFLTGAMGSENDPNLMREKGLRAVSEMYLEEVDQYIDEPMVAINPEFANREINAELKNLLDRWREERDITPGRNRSDLYNKYLQVWDLREGWSKGEYHNEREMKFVDVAKSVGRDLSTVIKQYRMAFQLITGYEYSRPRWLRFMGILKLSRIVSEESGEVSRHLPLATPSRRDVPDSVVTPLGSADSIIQQLASGDSVSETLITDAVIDIETLVEKGKTNQEILETLELPSSCAEWIDLIREGGGLGDRP